MRAPRRYYVDTNIFITAYEQRDEISDYLSKIFALSGRSTGCFVTSELTLSELLVLPYRLKDQVRIDTYSRLLLTSGELEVIPVDRKILRYAAFLCAQFHKIKLPDAIHLSTAMGANCSHFLSNDHGITGEYALRDLNDQRMEEPNTLSIIRPDIPTLTSLRPDIPTLTSLLQSLTS